MEVFREVQKKDGARVNEWAGATKSIYSLFILTATFRAIVNRYLDYVSSFDDPSDGLKKLDKATETTEVNGRKYKGFNFFSKEYPQTTGWQFQISIDADNLRAHEILFFTQWPVASSMAACRANFPYSSPNHAYGVASTCQSIPA
jgi:hypothetical protein